MRATFTVVHRWAGLFIAVFLVHLRGHGRRDLVGSRTRRVAERASFRREGDGRRSFRRTIWCSGSRRLMPRVKVVFFPLSFEEGHNADLFVEPRVDPKSGELYPARLQSSLHRSRERESGRQALLGRNLVQQREHSAVPLQAPLLDAHSGFLGHRPLGLCGSWALSASSGCSTALSAST